MKSSVQLKPEKVERADLLADRRGGTTSRSEVLRDAIDEGLPILEDRQDRIDAIFEGAEPVEASV